jgi:hypothetical protein
VDPGAIGGDEDSRDDGAAEAGTDATPEKQCAQAGTSPEAA